MIRRNSPYEMSRYSLDSCYAVGNSSGRIACLG